MVSMESGCLLEQEVKAWMMDSFLHTYIHTYTHGRERELKILKRQRSRKRKSNTTCRAECCKASKCQLVLRQEAQSKVITMDRHCWCLSKTNRPGHDGF